MASFLLIRANSGGSCWAALGRCGFVAADPARCVGRIVDRDHLVDRGDLSIDCLDPGRQFLDLAEQLGTLTLQFLVDLHLLLLR
ncbi:hypothetical protein [Bosea sp. BIWAKO-01]|uniref:hypothetical protein n=1 Tax=Bosea sp. BIWAKO-01 TaxID=506668 RepID=UPI00114D0184|nr:hypothetical protein [Bosea sp. BIWAKO-01]